jgi:hypothetical protein
LGFVRWVFAGSVPFRLFAAVGGECESWCFFRGYSVVPSALDKPSYLEPNGNSLQNPIGGRSEKTGGGVRIGAENRQTDVENTKQAYLQPISGSLQKPIEDLSLLTQKHAKPHPPPKQR